MWDSRQCYDEPVDFTGLLIDLCERKNQIQQLKQRILKKSELDHDHKAGW